MNAEQLSPCSLSWDQNGGRLACSGNVKLCRVWDARAEKTMVDLPMPAGKGVIPTSIACDLTNDMLSCGFTDGSFATYDVRLPGESCLDAYVWKIHSPIASFSARM
jgi:hypothetical protein